MPAKQKRVVLIKSTYIADGGRPPPPTPRGNFHLKVEFFFTPSQLRRVYKVSWPTAPELLMRSLIVLTNGLQIFHELYSHGPCLRSCIRLIRPWIFFRLLDSHNEDNHKRVERETTKDGVLQEKQTNYTSCTIYEFERMTY